MSDGRALGIPGYDEVEEIGRGGFGIVYRARQRDLDRTVAVKVLTSVIDERSRSRFDRERRALGALSDHPNIVTIYESGTTEHGLPFLTMEHLAGGSLADRIDRQGPVDWPMATSVIVAVCGAVETAHHLGVLHRDIKPENILLDRRDHARLADFGIAGNLAGSATATGSITASIGHAAPEVLAGQRATAAADVYSLGSTLFALLTGAPAFVRPTDESLMPIVVRVASEPVPDLRPAGVPAEVCEAVERAMAKEPAERYPSAAALGEALQAAQVRHGRVVTPMVVEAITVEPPTGAVAAVESTAERDRGVAPLVLPAFPPLVVDGGATAGAPVPTVSSETVAVVGKTGGAAGAHAAGDVVPEAAKTVQGAGAASAGGKARARSWGPDGAASSTGKAAGRITKRAMVMVGTGVAAVVAVSAVVLASGGGEPSADGASVTTETVVTEIAATEPSVTMTTEATTATTATTTTTEAPAPATTVGTTVTSEAASPPTVDRGGRGGGGAVGGAGAPVTASGSDADVVTTQEPATPVTDPPTTAPPPPPSVSAPSLAGLTEQEAADATRTAQGRFLPQAYSSFSARRVCNGNVDPANFGRVYAQNPPPGTALSFGQPVSVDVYQPCAAVPDVRGQHITQARSTLGAAGLQLSQTSGGTCQPGLAGFIVYVQDQAPGAIVPANAAVGVVSTPVNCP